MIALTFDVDWAPDAVLEDTISLLADAGYPATFFATHATRVLADLPPTFEMALHPNFQKGPPYEPVLDELQAVFPLAKGVRSHGLMRSSQLTDLYCRRGLRYDSSIMAYGAYDVQPFMHPPEFWHLPFHWGDYTACLYDGPWDADALLHASASRLVVLNFHPVHVFLNTSSAQHYADAKPHYQDPATLLGLRKPEGGRPGVREFLLSFLRRAKEQGRTFSLLQDACGPVKAVPTKAIGQ